MKIVHSLWTTPWKGGAHRVKRGFPTNLHYWASWAYSALTAKAAYGNVHLVSDTRGAAILTDRLKLPYDSVRLDLDDLGDVPRNLWAFGKLAAYAVQDEPFWHIDNDAFFMKRLPAEYETAAVLAQSVEAGPAEGVWPLYGMGDSIDAMPVRMDGWAEHFADRRAYCMGIFGGTNVDAIRDYAAEAMRVVRDDANANAWGALAAEAGAVSATNVIIEQQGAYCYFAGKGVAVSTLVRPDDADMRARGNEIGFIHLQSRRRNVAQSQKMLLRLEAEYPATYERLIRYAATAPPTAVSDGDDESSEPTKGQAGFLPRTDVVAVDRNGNPVTLPAQERRGTRGGCGCSRDKG